MSSDSTVDDKDFVDFSAFVIAVDAVDSILKLAEGVGEDSPLPESLESVDLDSLVELRKHATQLIQKIGNRLDDAMEVLLGAALDKAHIRAKTQLALALKGGPLVSYSRRAQFLVGVLPRLISHQPVINDVVPQASQQMMHLIRAASASSPIGRLTGISDTHIASGSNSAYKKWEHAASALCGIKVAPHEELAVDLKEAGELVHNLHQVTRTLETKNPNDPDSAALTEKKAEIQTSISQVIDNSSDPQAVKTVVAQEINQKKPFATKVGSSIKGGLNPIQEECVMYRGRCVIAAGAGSGKTRVLAAKVVYHMQELGLPPSAVMAVSFSQKSAGELKERVLDYADQAGLKMDHSGYYPGMGTTHSIARMVLNMSGRYKISPNPKAPERERVINGSEITNLVKTAIAQVKMDGGKGKVIPKEAKTFFPNLPPVGSPTPAPGSPSTDALTTVKSPVRNPVQPGSPIDYYLGDVSRYGNMISTAIQTLQGIFNSIQIKVKNLKTKYGDKTLFEITGPGIHDYYGDLKDLTTPGGKLQYSPANQKFRSPESFQIWAPNGVNIDAVKHSVYDRIGFSDIQTALNILADLGTKNPSTLSEEEKNSLHNIVSQTVVAKALVAKGLSLSTTKTAAEPENDPEDDLAKEESDPDEDAFLEARESMGMGMSDKELEKHFTADGIQAVEEEQTRKVKNNKDSPYYFYLNNPAGQWFNIKAPESAFEIKDDKGNKKSVPISTFIRYIGLTKNRMIAPGEAWGDNVGASLADLGEDAADEDVGDSKISDKIMAAVYGAYEWLKANAPNVKGRLDYDDQLIQSSRVLTENPALLRRLQSQYKCVLVDEAQDLNKCQHILFGLIAGYTDPATLGPRSDGKMTADTFAFIGDDKQCCEENSPANTPNGTTLIKDLKPGDLILSYRNGKVVSQTVRVVNPTSWTWGYKVTTSSGRTLTMSPNHKLWASEPELKEDQTIVYLMHRRDLGFRIGITNCGKDDTHTYLFGQRPVSEKAEKFWILNVCDNREEALTLEDTYSLRYQVPKILYHLKNREMSSGYEKRITTIYEEFGRNGAKILEDKHLSFDLPHWMARTFTKEGRITLRILAHGTEGTVVYFDTRLGVSAPVETKIERKWFSSYREASLYAEKLRSETGYLLSQFLMSPEGAIRKITASGLFPGMNLVTLEKDGKASMDSIETIERVNGRFISIDVDDASNFFAGEILTSNSIYEFRGAEPDLFIDKSDRTKGGEGFKTFSLDTNYRSGSKIVEAANRLIAHNSKQIPMVCVADPARGEGSIKRHKVPFAEDGPEYMADRIDTELEEAKANGQDISEFFKDYGLAVRTNNEVGMYAMAMIEKGIPFRSKKNFFSGPILGPVISLFKLFSDGVPINERNECVIKGVRSPNFGVNGKTLQDKLDGLKAGDYYKYLEDGGYKNIYNWDQMTDKLKSYVDFLKELEDLAKNGDSKALLNFIITYKTPDGTNFGEQLAVEIKNNPEEMEEVKMEAAENDSEITPAMLVAQALKPLGPLFKVADRYSNAKDFIGYIDSLVIKNYRNNKTDSDDIAGKANVVTIDTVHGWKGLETKHLFLPMTQGKFPHFKAMDDEKSMESERRLAYVAFTRGRDDVTVIEPELRMVKGEPKSAPPSQFTEEACIPSDTPPKTANLRTACECASSFREEPPLGEAEIEDPLLSAWGPTLSETL